MKKTISLIFVSVFLFSCGKTEEKILVPETLTGGTTETLTGEIDTQNPTESENQWVQTEEQSETPASESDRERTQTDTEVSPETNSTQSEIEEEVVEDFNEELEEIFKLLETDDAQ